MLDISGTKLSEEDIELISQPEVGGLILFTRNYTDRARLICLTSHVRELRDDLIIAVDQEGGRVQRFRNEFETLPSLQKIGDLARSFPEESEQICFSLGWLMAVDILSVGIDISFAPVLDLDRDSCPAISDRSFSENPEEAVHMCRAYIAGMKEAGMASTAKHFPGHGSVDVDSHLDLPLDERSLSEVRSHDLIPFMALSSEYDAVMPSHIKFPNIDDQSVGFSRYWLQQVLRDEMSFDGVIFSDDLTMEGAAASGSYSDRARLALDAGCDMLLPCNNRDGVIEILDFLRNQRNVDNSSGFEPMEGIKSGFESAERINRMKAKKQWTRELFLNSDIYAQAQQYLDQIRNQK